MIKRIPSSEILHDLADQLEAIDSAGYFKRHSESAFERQAQEIFAQIGVLSIKLPDKTSELTLPDLLNHGITEDGIFITFYMECKRRKKKFSPKQASVFPLLAEYACVLFCDDFQKLSILIRSLGDLKCWPPHSLSVSS